MKFCSKCGKEILDEAVVCPNCGCSVKNEIDANDAPSAGFSVLSFFFPIVGLILYLVYKDRSPMKAKSAGKWAFIGFCVGIAVSVVWGLVIGSLLGSMFNSMLMF